ncbi:DegT/DnrJ/EryC1/StrS family aminotransferase [Phaeodactylibacter sp.]|uniref:DegT/DnrJ/EryC1/StrS family aminotransferase n=1 Tax=Phaeodactylibacter sp. TaxID=1940289 RepID=UPI0025EFB531|nr:DegT/DnrJ/EryC1/StrS family aminotransferase [Phaeodactylibacter sp.]MCI4649022.1 DegT/DnrJ/EryC1/StrS family aminotransferase [Phaeodactylibacter sp.]MCI5090780.1 DegT/DnrJ/EryC1/StrS family aminotransferase [Phaeodactylibacter sp.]
MIPVTKPFLPPKQEVYALLNGVWERNWLTNNGPLVNEYEIRLKQYLGLKHLLFVSNGTIALQIAIKALGLKGEIITTPFSYVATTSSIVWEGCTPVFVDIDEETLNIDPEKIADAITPQTSAILATHCFGNACDIDAIDTIAKKHNLKVIYDAAHCFGTTYKGKSIFEYGDISTLSLHATKPVHSVEGGLVVTQDPELLERMAFLRNFGHDGPENFNGVGINGKNSELHAAVGLVVLNHADEILENRKKLSLYYDRELENLKVRKPKVQEHCGYNHAYYPIIFGDEAQALTAKVALDKQEIFCRRYFFPSLNKVGYVNDYDMPVSEKIAQSILCLPLYYGLSNQEQFLIKRNLLRLQNYG